MKDNNKISQELLEIIERYINGSMPPQELKDFNQLLELDNDFKTKVEDVKIMLSGIETQSLKEKHDELHQDNYKTSEKKSSTNKIRFLYYRKIAIAAAIIFAIGSIWFFATSKNDKLFTKYFKPDPGITTTAKNPNNLEFYDAMENYKHGNFIQAINKWRIIQERKPNNDTLNYFIGVAYLSDNNIIDAIPFLERSIEADDSFIFLDEAYLYLGLAYLKEGNLELAKKHLSTSETSKARKLISELKK
ncbi:hypothetical protein [uncultured Algibacter sp.]|uniref:tetratricopeptide repeat protein n=1 Tax=uncultured Algibacter sp. TaxID=298659 RepID=UPI00261F00FC|nr:hypothetical protein [uncultured Algibacter sp.]